MSHSEYKCPLCGFEFDNTEEKCHSCPVAGKCNVICCPNCGYGFTGESGIVGWFKKLFGSKKTQSGEEDRR